MAHGDITHIEIPATDLARAGAFYHGLFGWDIQTSPDYPDYPMWRAPNQISGGALSAPTEDFTSPRSFVEVDSIDDVLAQVVELGGAVTIPKKEITPTSWWAAFTDLDGNSIGLYEGTMEG